MESVYIDSHKDGVILHQAEADLNNLEGQKEDRTSVRDGDRIKFNGLQGANGLLKRLSWPMEVSFPDNRGFQNTDGRCTGTSDPAFVDGTKTERNGAAS